MSVPKIKRLFKVVAAVAITAFTGCDVFGPDERVVVMDVAPQRVTCFGAHGPLECLFVREHPDTAWTYLPDGIEGFEFEPGFEYTLLVAVRTISDPPQDGSSLVYRLIEIRRKEPA